MNKSVEDYLKAIYDLGGNEKIVANKEIAKKIGVSAPSVSEMVKKLVKKDYLIYKEYIGVKLTPKGIKSAKKVRKRHLLWEVFLVEKLGYDWSEVDREAEKLEHITDEKLEKRLEKYLNYPKTCPHGNLIDEGEKKYINLLKLKEGDKGIIKRVEDEKDILEFMNLKGLKIGEFIEVINTLDNKLILFSKGEKLEISKELGEKIFIDIGGRDEKN